MHSYVPNHRSSRDIPLDCSLDSQRQKRDRHDTKHNSPGSRPKALVFVSYENSFPGTSFLQTIRFLRLAWTAIYLGRTNLYLYSRKNDSTLRIYSPGNISTPIAAPTAPSSHTEKQVPWYRRLSLLDYMHLCVFLQLTTMNLVGVILIWTDQIAPFEVLTKCTAI